MNETAVVTCLSIFGIVLLLTGIGFNLLKGNKKGQIFVVLWVISLLFFGITVVAGIIIIIRDIF